MQFLFHTKLYIHMRSGVASTIKVLALLTSINQLCLKLQKEYIHYSHALTFHMSFRRSAKRNNNKDEDSDQQFQHSYDPSADSNGIEETRTRPTRKCKVNYTEQQQKSGNDIQPEEIQTLNEITEIYQFLTPQVECLLWKENHEQPNQQRYLVKYQNKSYLQTQWLTRQQLSAINFEINSSVLKSLKIKMRKAMDLKLKQGVFFNPNYLIPDRILISTEIFTAIHHKRANDIKGKWDESIMLVCQKLLNFVKDGYPYGVLLHEPYNEELQKAEGINVRINIGQILNKVYLSYYKNQWEFWIELGIAIRNYLKIYKPDKGDYHKVGLVMKDCAVFLYQQWHILCSQRYQAIKKQRISKEVTPIQLIQQKTTQEQTERKIQIEGQISLIEQLCKNNIFLTDKIVDSPRSQTELELLNPLKFSYDWLNDQQNTNLQQKQTTFLYLTQADLRNMDLNVEVDKLYYIKWKDLSYSQASWQSQKRICCPQKIQQFRLCNKIPVRQIRQKVQLHNKIHRFLMESYEVMSEKKDNKPSDNIVRMEATLYLLDAGMLGKPKQYKPDDLTYKNYRKLKDFQIESLNWLISSWYENKNTILADEMGLGKTIQTIAFLNHLSAHQNVVGPFLVLAPLTTLHQWRRQIQEWTNFNCLLYYDEGRPQIREMIQEYEFYHLHTTKSGDIIPSRIPKFQVLLTNYELFMSDFQLLKKIPFQHMVLDEAHRLKNKQTKTTRTLSKLPCRRKTLLTGTPIQNNTKELWTLLNFIQPKDFAREEDFMEKYGNLSTEEQVKDFKKMLKPYLLRRVKEDVESTIPKLSETIIDVEMTSLQKRYYRGIYEKNKTSMIKSLSAANFNSIATQLRKCCNHPYLISPETEAEIKSESIEREELQLFIKSSGKTLLLMKLLQKFKRQGKKVLLFSQFVIMLDLLRPFLQMAGYICEILKGSQSSTSRHQAITRFNHQKTDIFLISTKAGGVGINLVAATEIIIFDSDWNPQNDIQATARAHRIGQKKEVTVYRLITANSYESVMFQSSSKKLGLDKAVFSGDTFKSMGQFDETQKQLSKADIQMLLKRGIVGFLDSKIDEQQFFNQTIEDILQKNARKVEYSLSQNSCTFSKTKFKSEESNDIEINAKDFWEQALKNVETPVDKLVKKRTELREYTNLDSQQNLLLQAHRIVFDFVKQKSGGTNFNAEDQRNLLRFLQAINSDRHFNRHLRDIADLLLGQILKPSRRFKVKQEDIRQINHQNQIIREQESNSKRESSRIKEQKKSKKQNYGLGDEGEGDQISDIQQQKEETPDEDVEKNQEQTLNEDYERLCFLCEKPKCTIFCSGICGRSFHRKCFFLCQKNSYQKPQHNQLDEISFDLERWRQARQFDQTCVSCNQKNYMFKCSVCLKIGLYLPDESVSHKKKKSSRMKKEEKNGDENTLYRCSAAGKCNKFFHLSCLFSPEFEGKFSDHTGKTVKDVSTPSKLFRCPAHYCHVCYGIDSKSTKLRSFGCIRCCLSFHDKCLDKEKFLRLGHEHYYICADHLQPDQSLQQMTDQIRLFKPSKRDRALIKKKLKEGKSSKKPKKEQDDEGQEYNEKNKNNSESTHELRSLKKQKKRENEINSIQTQNIDNQIEQQKDRPLKEVSKVKSKGEKHSKIKKQLQGDSKKEKSKDILKKDYQKYNLTPIAEFQYEQYSYNWCRYCGARYAPSFEVSPWGLNKLCSHHHHKWKEGALRLDKYKNEPKHPIKKDKDNEIRYLNDYSRLNKVLPEEAVAQLNDKKYSEQLQQQ